LHRRRQSRRIVDDRRPAANSDGKKLCARIDRDAERANAVATSVLELIES
jgi:hypothetical protein